MGAYRKEAPCGDTLQYTMHGGLQMVRIFRNVVSCMVETCAKPESRDQTLGINGWGVPGG
jgi:hypothetical protein